MPAVLTLQTTTAFSWTGGVELRLDSETFAPGRDDPRVLGVRIHDVRVSPAGGPFAPGLPPPLPLLWALAAVQIVFWTVATTPGARGAREAGFLAAALVAIGIAGARAWTVGLLPWLVVALLLAFAIVRLMPWRARATAALVADAGRRVALGVRSIRPGPLAALAILAAVGTVAAYRAQPVLVIPMASGREIAFERGLGSFDSLDGVRFRHVTAPAELDLRDAGGGPWRIAVTASVAGAPRSVPILDAGSGAVSGMLGPQWSMVEAPAVAPTGWHSGLVLGLPGARRDDVRVREVRIDRGRASPPIRIVAGVGAAGLLLFLAVVAGGMSVPAGWTIGAVAALLEIAALAVDPVATIPDVPRLAAIATGGTLLTALAAAVAFRPREARPPSEFPAPAIVAGGIGFMAWLATTTTSLYRGGHFVFHSSIAEEIWKGSFLLYYLPYPGSMLSQQAQWGNVIVPHPALYHTLVSPLAALPRPEFFAAEKVLLALLFAAMVWASASLALRVGSPFAASAAAVLMASMPASFQLLGLGHLMTILGCWALTMAVEYVARHAEALDARPQWWRATFLLALAFLSYFAGLLFLL
ncbi:MAG TPA: hypothetical protein VGQ33_16020, partial [Vicinamibacteria bacterium]|nr:hypothetical protein [Vicinamibacteria bacterium]